MYRSQNGAGKEEVSVDAACCLTPFDIKSDVLKLRRVCAECRFVRVSTVSSEAGEGALAVITRDCEMTDVGAEGRTLVLSKPSLQPAGRCMGSSRVAKKTGQRRAFLCLKYAGLLLLLISFFLPWVGFLVAQFGKLLCSRYLDTRRQVRSL